MTDPAPEPCDTCSTNLALLRSYDGLRRCQRCVQELAATWPEIRWPPDAQ